MTDLPEEPRVPMFTVTSEPLPMQPETFTTLGEIVIHWGRIESAVDDDLADMRKFAVVRNPAPVLPHTFSQKLTLWRRSVRTLYPKVEAYQLHAEDFLLNVRKVAQLRNHLIHGTWTLSENENGDFLVMNLRSIRGQERHDSIWVGQQLLDQLLHDVQMLSGVIIGFRMTKMVHAHAGLLRVDRGSQHENHAQDHPTQTAPQGQREPPPSSEG